jgi:glutamate-ammonia-ligase adenylyltransferase
VTTADAVVAACPDVEPRVVREFLARMDPDYLSAFDAEEIARHVRLSTRLDRSSPALVEVSARGEGRFDVVVVGLDYFSLLSVVCGLLASFGLDIESGSVSTFEPSRPVPAPAGRRRPVRASPKKIVDVFRVRLLPQEEGFAEAEAARLQDELTALVRLLGEDRVDEARDRVNRRLAEHFERVKPEAGGVLYPVDVRFDNESDPRWTLVDVHARDTPAFLYAVTNALAARGVYVQRVDIGSRGRDVRDRFHVSDRLGRKIPAGADQEALRVAIVLAKQFTHVLPRAPDPAMATRHFDQLDHKLMESSAAAPALLQEEQGLAALARLLGSSDFLWGTSSGCSSRACCRCWGSCGCGG